MGGVFRYEDSQENTFALDPFESVVSWVEGFTSPRYVQHVLGDVHSRGLSREETRRKAKSISALVAVACKYMEQADRGPKEVSYLPLYYSCLNLLKALIVASPLESRLADNRKHGASYPPAKRLGSLMSERICLWVEGTIPLYYQTVTGQTLDFGLHNYYSVRMAEVYPLILQVQSEYHLGGGTKEGLVPFTVHLQTTDSGSRVTAEYVGLGTPPKEREIYQLQAFVGLKCDASRPHLLVSEWYSHGSGVDPVGLHVRRCLLYDVPGSTSETHAVGVPKTKLPFLVPEEFAIILALFHMSSVARYHPEQMDQLLGSPQRPLLLVLRRDAVFTLLLRFCCEMMNKRLVVLAG